MFNYEMDLSSYFTCLHVQKLLLFIPAIITYGICLSYMLVLFGIRIFNLFKYVESMSLISLNLQQNDHLIVSTWSLRGLRENYTLARVLQQGLVESTDSPIP
jgi:hypothetical protein